MFGSFGPGEIILILVVLLLVFGARRIPELGGALGKGIREFKSSVRDEGNEVAKGENRDQLPAGSPQAGAQRPGESAEVRREERDSRN